MPLPECPGSDRIALLVGPTSRDAVIDAAACMLGNSHRDSTTTIADSLREREPMA